MSAKAIARQCFTDEFSERERKRETERERERERAAREKKIKRWREGHERRRR